MRSSGAGSSMGCSVYVYIFIICSTQLVISLAGAQKEEAPPKFADNYRVSGVLSLPYAEINEPFTAYYDKKLDRSRTDYYGGDYKIFQFGPSGAKNSTSSSYGSMYKFLFVPKDFHSSPTEGNGNTISSGANRLKSIFSDAYKRVSNVFQQIAHRENDNLGVEVRTNTRTPVKRICFGVNGGTGFTISAQSVLPDLKDFEFDSIERCPHLSDITHRHNKCELWKLVTKVGDKKNTYKFWLRRNHNDPSTVIPVHYFMLGYDSLLGSHYDRYDITYRDFVANKATDIDFETDTPTDKCGSMPGPGDTEDQSERRAHMAISNPIHEFVSEPNRYDHVDHHFNQFQAEHSKEYLGEDKKRQGWINFMHNLRFILSKNRELKEYKLAVNKFADINVNDLKYLRGRLHSKGYNGGLDYAGHHNLKKGGGAVEALPDSIDWEANGAVTPVKDQAVCGSCWSFGTVGTIEGANFVKTGKLLRLSQQQLVDCSWQFGNNGCDGGEDFRAYQYIEKAGGLSLEEDYGHYLGIDGKCHDKDVPKPVKLKGFYNVTANSVDALKHAIVNYGPVSISIDASQNTFAFYSHGAYYDPKCQNSPDNLDHAVLAVGYMNLNGKLVWKVKNSWSTYWGNNGYIYMSADNNNCGVLDAPTVPIIDAK